MINLRANGCNRPDSDVLDDGVESQQDDWLQYVLQRGNCYQRINIPDNHVIIMAANKWPRRISRFT